MAEIGLWVIYAGLAVAMVGGATWPTPTWWLVAVGLGVVAVGVALKRKAGAPPLEHGDAGRGVRAARRGSLRDGVREMAQGVRELATRAHTLDPETLKARIEELHYLGPDRVGEAQEAITARIGFAKYAEVMAPLATAERLLYRAWSAATDGHRPECLRSIGDAVPHAEEALTIAERVLPTE